MYRIGDTPQSLHCYYGTTGEGWPGWPDVGWEQNHTTKNSRALPRGGAYPLGTKGHHVMYRTSDTPQSLHCYYGATGEGWPDVGWEQNHTTKNSRALPRGGPTPLVKKKDTMYRTLGGRGRGGLTWGGSKAIQQKIRERYRGGGGGATPLVQKDTIMYRTWDTPQSLHCYYGTTGEGWPDVGWE